ncbi:hypothetical protein LWI29_024301 [Acer saccharum]|uniref:Hyccin n=1 Tax=Acer saccharum TaxID=4024 RepID=A0AA39THF9_ACESA|nr:hypothetical protein LWI29_024301 [Acer saccharum]KAK1587349.1 hypothetical protein Q3G72_011966 [Acer saccharum]
MSISESAHSSPTAIENTRSTSIRSTFKAQSAIESLSSIITTVPDSPNPSSSLLNDPEIASQISSLLRQADAGAGNDNLCRWLYDTFQSTDPQLQLVVLRFLPILAGVYLSRVTLRKPLAGFEAVLLALYAHETTSRSGQSMTVNVPDISHPSIYHESNTAVKNNATNLNLEVISPSLEPHGTVRSTKRARIVGVALELYYSKISQLPVASKIDFCEFCEAWAIGGDHQQDSSVNNNGERMRIPLSWELVQPILRILGHCLMGPDQKQNKQLFDAAYCACKSLYGRSLHDINPKAMLATGSLLSLAELSLDDIDYTEIRITNAISL